MKPAPFAWRAPRTLEAALAELARNDGARPLAGGQSLVPMLNLRLAPADTIVDLGRIESLRAVQARDGAVVYGALTAHAAFEDGKVPDAANGLLRTTGAGIAFRAVRTRGTLGGSLALADPAADWLTVMVALQARLHLASVRGERVVEAGAFVLGAYYTVLEPDELVCAVEVARRPAAERWGRCKVARKVGEYADSMAVVLRGTEPARIVLGATDGAPLLLAATAAELDAGASRARLTEALADELAVRGFEAIARRRHVACVLRAIEATEVK
jgi:carbon-monoxide dehydrogenase medium subunit